jgi:protein-serine/threonine kinase
MAYLPCRTIKAIKSRSVTVEAKPASQPSREEMQTPVPPTPGRTRKASTPIAAILPEVRQPVKPPLSASTSKAQKVMKWFRGKQRVSSDLSTPEVIIPIESDYSASSGQVTASFQIATALESTSSVNRSDAPAVTVTPASPENKGRIPNPLNWLPGRSVSGGNSTLISRGGQAPGLQKPYDPALIRIHHGAVDVGTVASGSPPDLFQHVTQVLMTMGVDMQKEAEYKYRCVRPKRRREGQSLGLGLREPGSSSLSAFNVSGSATLNGVS